MSDFAALELAMQRSLALAAGVCLALLVLTGISLAYAFSTAGTARELEQRMPVLVVPGAVGGVYSPGLTEEHLRAAARYLSGLATNFGSSRNFAERFDELESFAAASYLPGLQRARAQLQRDVETQNQSRSFFADPATESLRQLKAGHFEYAVRGERTVYASGLPMDTRASELHLRLQWGTPSQRNRAGVFLEGFELADAAAPAQAAAEQAAALPNASPADAQR